MRIEYYVVRREQETITDKANIQKVKESLIKEYGGLTVISNALGYWVNSEGKLSIDSISLWTIIIKDGAKETETPIILDYAKKLRIVCKQESQLVTIDNQPYFIG